VVVLGVVVGANGNARTVWVVPSLGRDLEESSVQTVNSWKSVSATKDGNPVATVVNVEATFRVY